MKNIYLFLFILFIPLMTKAQDVDLQKINPLGEEITIEGFIARLIRALLGLSGAVALLMFVWGGFLWLTSRGETGAIKKGKDTLTWAMIGLFIIFTAYILVNAIIGAITQGNVINPTTPEATP